MTPQKSARRSFAALLATGSALAGAALLAGCGTPAPPPPPPPPPALVPPPVALSDSLVQDAAAYKDYMGRVTAITPDFKSGADVASSLKTGDSYDPQQLLRGSIAYAAIIALQDKEFVTQVQVFAANPVSRPLLTDDILGNPNYVVGLKGADSAAGLIIATMMDQGQKLHAAGELVKQSAYSIQRQSWSQQLVVNPGQRLTEAKAIPDIAAMSSRDNVERMRQAAVGSTPLGMSPATPATQPYPPVVVRGMALAALAILGEAGPDQASRVAPIVNETGSAECLSEAKMNLYQCLAVSKPHYEDVFCLGQHVMMDTGQCVMVAAGAPPPVYTPVAHSSTEVSYSSETGAKAKKKHKKPH